MKLLTLLILSACTALAEVPTPLITEALRLTENSPRHRIGRAHERSEYQLTPPVWRQFSKHPLWVARSSKAWAVAEQKRVAEAYVDWLRKHISSPTPWRIAVAYNAEPGALERVTFPNSSVDYANRFCNILAELQTSPPR